MQFLTKNHFLRFINRIFLIVFILAHKNIYAEEPCGYSCTGLPIDIAVAMKKGDYLFVSFIDTHERYFAALKFLIKDGKKELVGYVNSRTELKCKPIFYELQREPAGLFSFASTKEVCKKIDLKERSTIFQNYEIERYIKYFLDIHPVELLSMESLSSDFYRVFPTLILSHYMEALMKIPQDKTIRKISTHNARDMYIWLTNDSLSSEGEKAIVRKAFDQMDITPNIFEVTPVSPEIEELKANNQKLNLENQRMKNELKILSTRIDNLMQREVVMGLENEEMKLRVPETIRLESNFEDFLR